MGPRINFWKLPGMGLALKGLDRFGGAFLPRPQVPPLPPDAPVGPLDAFTAAGRGQEGFWAGAACVDITPEDPEDAYLAGFAPGRRCQGLRDPLFARCLVLRVNEQPFVLVSLDLIGLFANRIERMRSLISRRHPSAVWICSTHNHQSPDTLGIWGPALANRLPIRSGVNPAYMALLETRVLQAVEQAVAGAQPARLFARQGVFDKAGHWVHNERSPVIDRDLRILQVDDERGRSIATLVQHACHPETLWTDNHLMTADFPAVCCKRVEEKLGGTALFVNGALGAMVSAAVGDHTPRGIRDAWMETLGKNLGRTAVRMSRRARRDPPLEASLHTARKQVVLPAEDNRLFAFLHAMGIIEGRDLSRGLHSELGLAQIGDLFLLALPGEAAPELGLELLARLPGKPAMLLGLTNDELGYLLPPEFFHDPAYAYEQGMSPGPMAATRLSLALEGLLAAWPEAGDA